MENPTLSDSVSTIIFLLVSLFSFGQNTWTGNIDNQWDVDGNWSYGHVPSPVEEVLISSDSVSVPHGFVAQIAKLTVHSAAIISIEEGGILNVKRSNLIVYDQGGVENFGKLYCAGTFNVDSMEFAAIVNYGQILVMASGSTLLMNNAGGLVNSDVIVNQGILLSANTEYFGIYNSGNLTNHGSILIRNYQQPRIENDGPFGNYNSVVLENGTEGISSYDSLYNAPGAHIEIHHMSGEAYHDAFSTGRITINAGKISIDSVSGKGIRVIGKFTNSDSIMITNALQGFVNEGHLVNHSGGYINSRNTRDGLMNWGVVENSGKLVIDSSYNRILHNEGQLLNYDTISLLRVGKYGIYNNDSLINKIGSHIEISGNVSIDDYAIRNRSLLLNFGKIDIKDFSGGGIENMSSGLNASLINYDTIIIQTARKNGIQNFDSLHNEQGGVILIKNINQVYSAGIAHYDGDFINEGLIILENITGTAIGSNSYFANHSTIRIHEIDGNGIVTGVGVLNEQGDFFNYDTIFIKNCTKSSVYNVDTLYNLAGAFLSIDSSHNGITNVYQFSRDSPSLISNSGSLMISNCTEYGLRSSSTFENHTPGEIHIIDAGTVPFEAAVGSIFNCQGTMNFFP